MTLSRPAILNGKQSCGCNWTPSSRKYTDEQRESFLYTTWSGMKQRCYNVNSEAYPNYGGRGIKVCNEWREDYLSFYNWSILNGASEELTIDRIDVNGNYTPENCRWVSNSVQQRNKQYNRYIEYNGQRKLMLEWAEETGLRITTITSRLERRWDVGEVLGYEHHARKGSKHTKRILQYDKDMNLIKEWHSLHFIRKETNRSKKTILRYLENGEIDTRGFYWRYKED